MMKTGGWFEISWKKDL